MSEGIKCEMDSPPKSLLEEVERRPSAAGTPGSRRSRGRRREPSWLDGWWKRFISSLTSVAWLPMLESDAADRGGAREMRGVETPQPQRRHLLPLARPAEVSPAALQFSEERDRSTPKFGLERGKQNANAKLQFVMVNQKWERESSVREIFFKD